MTRKIFGLAQSRSSFAVYGAVNTTNKVPNTRTPKAASVTGRAAVHRLSPVVWPSSTAPNVIAMARNTIANPSCRSDSLTMAAPTGLAIWC